MEILSNSNVCVGVVIVGSMEVQSNSIACVGVVIDWLGGDTFKQRVGPVRDATAVGPVV